MSILLKLISVNKNYVQYGCGLCAPAQWINFDVSPTLRLQKIPLLGMLFRTGKSVVFPPNVRYGDIVKGLPVADSFCDGIYCSHTLEHLSLEDFRKSLANTFRILKPGCFFRCVVPDLEIAAKEYLLAAAKGDKEASINFLNNIMLGRKTRPRGFIEMAKEMFGNSQHLWMWDINSLKCELEKTGFKNIRSCDFGDSSDAMFKLVENAGRFWHAAAVECTK
jgi:hypothetical protein